MRITDATSVLDRERLRAVTLDDEELMRDLVSALIEDSTRQMQLLADAIREQDSQATIRLAHYSKGACANVGANAAAATLEEIERQAGLRRFDRCDASLGALSHELDRLRGAGNALGLPAAL